MKLLEYEAKDIYRKYGIPVGFGFTISSPDEIDERVKDFGDEVVVKAQVDVGGRGKAGGVIIAKTADVREESRKMFAKQIKGVPVEKILLEEKLPIEKEYYVSITIDRSRRENVIIFSSEGGVEIEQTARDNPDAIRKVWVSPLLHDIPPFMLRSLLGDAPKELAPVINALYRVFCENDGILVEINPLVTTSKGVFAADGKFIVDDNALYRLGIEVNRD
ncbi:MAG: acetate--CoA ligase family protein, partial [Methanomicrobium sp.]|nr:acetate--CoA ligase family protein [Methanomicrobium sp.]